MKRTKLLIMALILSLLILGSVFATTFYFIFNQTPYKPTNYQWTEPWEVKQKVDFVEATLTLTGTGYKDEPHDVELALKNVATIPNYVILSMDYSATWNVGVESEVIIAGSTTEPLFVGGTTTVYGTFAPTLVGIGEVEMGVSNIQWVESETITWTTKVIDPEGGSYISVTNFAVFGASKTYQAGTANFTLTWIAGIGANGFISYKLEVPELSLLLKQELDIYLEKYIPKQFSVPFTMTSGGSLTMQLTLFNRHN
jgi:hypothetical protein